VILGFSGLICICLISLYSKPETRDQKMPSTDQVINHLLKNDRFSSWLGIALLEVDQGSCTISMIIREEMMNGFDIAHGGIIFSFADSALAIASNGYNKLSVALETSISFTTKVKTGDKLLARAKEISITNRIGVYQILITNQEDVTVAYFKGTVYRTSKTLFES
jgi:acyl-CoA thioesterase